MDGKRTYDASRITVVKGFEAIRRRPGMYVGSTTRRGLHATVVEVMEWAANGVLSCGGGRVDVTLLPGGGVRVADNGPGVGFAADPGAEGQEVRALDEQLREIADGPGPRDAPIALLMPGLSLCMANALSEHLTAEVHRAGTRWVQECARGVTTAPPAPAGPAEATGTALTFHPDPEIFETTEVDYDVLAERLRELAFLHPTLALTLTDERTPDAPRETRFHSPTGLAAFVAHLDAEAGEDVECPADILTVTAADPRMAGTLDVALRFRAGPPAGEYLRSYANSHPTPHGGSHVVGLRYGIAAALAAHGLGYGDLTAVVAVTLDAPSFELATPTRLGNPEVRECVADAVRDRLTAWVGERPDRAAALLGGRSRQE